MTAPRPDELLGDDQRTYQVPQTSYNPRPGQAPTPGYNPQAAGWDRGYATAPPTYPPAAGAQNAAGHWYAYPPAADTSATGYPTAGGASPMTPGYPVAGYPTPTQQRPKRRGMWIAAIGVAVLIVAIIATVIKIEVFPSKSESTNNTVQGAGTQSSTPAAPPVSANALTALLLSKPEIAQIVGATSMIGTESSGGQIFSAMGKQKYLDADCIILMPTELANYGGSGYTGSRSQFLDSPTKDRRIEQAVVSFPDAQSAANYVTKAKEKIGKCSNRSANFRETTETDDDWWTIGAPQDVDGVTTVPHNQEGNEGWSCQTGLTARNNVVVDLYVCGRNIADHVAVNFTKAIADHVDKQK